MIVGQKVENYLFYLKVGNYLFYFLYFKQQSQRQIRYINIRIKMKLRSLPLSKRQILSITDAEKIYR